MNCESIVRSEDTNYECISNSSAKVLLFFEICKQNQKIIMSGATSTQKYENMNSK